MVVERQERSNLVDDLLERVGQAVGRGAHVSAVFGEPVERDALTVIPVARSRFGFGGGGGSGSRQGDEGSGGGGGGGVSVRPIGYIELRDGGASFKRISTTTDLLALAFATSMVALTVKRLLA